MRCIEIIQVYQQVCKVYRLTLTWDVLKCWYNDRWSVLPDRLTLTWDVLKSQTDSTTRNHCCRLTLTWDVLKFFRWEPPSRSHDMININMRCIEIKGAQASLEAFAPININMRCIEINLGRPLTARNIRLTLTWDVLKCRQKTK